MADLKPHGYGSFSYKVLNNSIVEPLNNRSTLNNTIQVAMPFVKLTSTIKLPEYIGDGNIGFTLGLHAIDQDVKYEDMYSGAGDDVNCPLIGYTYTADGKTKRVYARPPSSEVSALINLFDGRKKLLNTTQNLVIPPPGITGVTIGRNKNGLLAQANINFSVPSLQQLEILHRTFLIPGVGMVLEWGQQFAQESITPVNSTFSGELSDISYAMFPWNNRAKLTELLTRLAKRQVGLEEILNDYVYASNGQYCWMFGRLANFSTVANSDGSFDCTAKIVGPSEDSWAYSVYNTVIPPSDISGQICAENVHSVASYFSGTVAGSLNLQTLLTKVINPANKHAWMNHVHKFEAGNNSEGEKKGGDGNDGTLSNATFAENDDAYFMTWKFFVNVVLNDPEDGIKKIFKLANMTDEQIEAKISLLRPYTVDTDTIDGAIDDPYESFVGMNKYLRSSDLSTMFIVNGLAVAATQGLPEYKLTRETWLGLGEDKNEFFPQLPKDLVPKIALTGDFSLSTSKVKENFFTAGTTDRGLLSSGVWINHKAVVESMMGAETILHGITLLLNKMNAATSNYWQLVLDASEPIAIEDSDKVKHEYTVIDANYRENSDVAVNEFLDKVYVFNKYARTDEDGKLVGSELTNCAVDLSLPKRLFSQIATLGLYRKEDLQTLNIENQTPGQRTQAITADPNETLRKMFGITSLSAIDDTGQGPDLTILPDDPAARDAALKVRSCTNGSAQQTAGTAGAGPGGVQIRADLIKELNELLSQSAPTAADFRPFADITAKNPTKQRERLTTELNGVVCKSCRSPASVTTRSAKPTNPANQTKASYIGTDGKLYTIDVATDNRGNLPLYTAGYRNGKLPQSILESIGPGHSMYREAAQKYKEMSQAAVSNGVTLTILSSYRDISGQISAYSTYGSANNGVKSKAKPNFYGAADPGTSDHGWGMAVDIDLQAYTWLTRNAARFGFATIDNDPIHWVYRGQISPPPAPPTTPVPVPVTVPPVATPAPTPTALPIIRTVDGEDRVCTPAEIARCDRIGNLLNELTTRDAAESGKKAAFSGLTRKFPKLEGIFSYVEPYPDLMVARIAGTADMDASNAFGASPGALSISADLTMPGINGFRVGELFWIERIPAFYKAFGAFQTISIEDVINTDGWTTKIHARFNYLGKKWKDSVVNILNSSGTGGE